MSQSETIARPYAKAAYQQALANESLGKWQEFLQISASFAKNEAIISRLTVPGFFSEWQSWLNESLEKNRGEIMRKEEENFLNILQENNRLSVLPEIAEQFILQMHQADGVCEAKVYSANVLESQQKSSIIEMLEKKLGKKVMLEVIEQADLLAGVRIEYDGLVLDQSTKGRIEQFAQKLEDLRN